MRCRVAFPLLACVAAGVAVAAPGDVSMREFIVFERIDMVAAGLGDIGAPGSAGGGAGTLVLDGVEGGVARALLYWYGVDLDDPVDGYSGGDADYDEAGILFDGQPVSGTRLGSRGHNNNWGNGDLHSGALYRADVTALVAGDGAYTVAGLADGAGHSAAGVSLIVYFDDGNPANDRRVVHFEAMDSNVDATPNQHWQMVLPIDYVGGSVEMLLHVADGQTSQSDGEMRFEVFPGLLPNDFTRFEFDSPHPDGLPLWGGRSVPEAGFGRPGGGGGLWDIRRFGLTAGFSRPRDYLLRGFYSGGSDLLTLNVVQLVQSAPGAPPAMDPPAHDFGDLAPGTASPAQAFVFTNHGNESITVVGASAVPSSMTLVSQDCSGAVLAPGATCTLSVLCTPEAGLPYAGVARVRWQGSDGEPWDSEAALQCAGVGTGTYGRVAVDPPDAWFGSGLAGEQGETRTFRITSIGEHAVTLQPTRTLGTHGFAFKVRGDQCAGRTLAPSQECTVDVVFEPAADRPVGRMEAQLRIQFDSSGEVHPLRDLPLGAVVLPDLVGIFRDGYESGP